MDESNVLEVYKYVYKNIIVVYLQRVSGWVKVSYEQFFGREMI